MHWWQIATRLLLIANCLGNVSDAIRTRQKHREERLHWLIPNALGWAALFFAVLPTRWGGVGMSHYQAVAWIGIVLLLYGMIMRMTDASQPLIPWPTIEVPHGGTIWPHLLPQFMTAVPLLGFLLVGGDIIYRHRITSADEVLLVGFSLGLLLGIRLCLRQYSVA